MSEPSVVHGPSLTDRIGSFPVFGAALTRAVSSLSCAYDNYGKHSSSPLVRRCVGAVESKLQPHLSRVEPVVHAGLDRLEGSVTSIRTSADTAVHAGIGRIETTVTTIRSTADSIRSTADLAVRQWRHLPATINSAVNTTAVTVEGRVAALASAGLTKADALVGWALAHVADEPSVTTADTTAAPAPAPVLDSSEWPTPKETREHDVETFALRHNHHHHHQVPPAFGTETKRVLTHLRALTTKIASELLPATLLQLRQIPGRGCRAVRTHLCSTTSAACGSVRGGVRQHKDRASVRVRQMRRAVQDKFTDVHIDNLIQQLFVFGLEGSARSLELLLRVTPDNVITFIRHKFGVDLRQVRRRLRILVNRAKAGQPIRPPTPTTATNTAPAAPYAEVVKHPSAHPTTPPSSSHVTHEPTFVAGASVSPHVVHDTPNDPEEHYSSDEVDDNETTGDDEDDEVDDDEPTRDDDDVHHED